MVLPTKLSGAAKHHLPENTSVHLWDMGDTRGLQPSPLTVCEATSGEPPPALDYPSAH